MISEAKRMKYIIYHVFGVKIGCTDDYPNRPLEQGFKEGQFEPLKELEFAKKTDTTNWIAGDLERDYQALYGFKYDTLHYAEAMRRRKNASNSPDNGFRSGAAWRASLEGPNHFSKSPNQPFKLGNQGRRTAELGKSGMQTGVAQKASAASPNHISKSPDNPWKTGAASRASAASPNHNTKQKRQCPDCGKMIHLPQLSRHMKARHGK